MTMLNFIWQLGLLIGTRTYADDDKLCYARGKPICAGFKVGMLCLSMGLRFVLALSNRTTSFACLKSMSKMGRVRPVRVWLESTRAVCVYHTSLSYAMNLSHRCTWLITHQ